MIVGRLTYDTVKQRHKALGELSPTRVPLSSEFMSKNLINERPLKSNLNDLSFKGLSFSGANQPTKQPAKTAKKEDKIKPTTLYSRRTFSNRISSKICSSLQRSRQI